jgi:HK97 family phage portal protein
MRLFGLEITRSKAVAPGTLQAAPSAVGDRAGWWWPVIREPFTGAWQRNIEVRPDTVAAYNAVYACISLIAGDISKLRIMLMQQDGDGIWTETTSPAFSPVLRKPNGYQNRIKFVQQWIISKLIHGNAYALVERDARQVVTALYVLDPRRVRALVAPDGSVYYEVRSDYLAGIDEDAIFPASEIIHDVMVPLYHPLVGVSPIYACGLSAHQGLEILKNSTHFFSNGAQPGGILTAPGEIDEDTASRLKASWEKEFTHRNVGRVAIMGSGLTWQPLSMTAVDAQLIEQLRLSSETVCSCFHVPPYMVAAGPVPPVNNVEALGQQYYTQCLQELIENFELSLREGLGLPPNYDIRLDIDSLLRMDTATQYKSIADAIRGGFLAPNEGRLKINLPPVDGGDSPYMQHQDYSLAALAKRDAMADPFGVTPPIGGTPDPSAAPPGDQPSPKPPPAASEPPPQKSLQVARATLRMYQQLGLLDEAA